MVIHTRFVILGIPVTNCGAFPRLKHAIEQFEYVLETELVDVDPDTASPEEITSYTKHSDDATKFAEKFRKQERIERSEVVKAFTNGKPRDGESICTHVQRMQGYVERFRKLEMPVHEDFVVDIVLNSLPSSYDQFTLAYHLNNSQATLAELHRMLRTAEDGMNGKKCAPDQPACPKQNWREKTHVGSSRNAPRAKTSRTVK
ncbi:hypothetical protein L1887_17857 [Cichorium endivia]|nr:hypothetical protein L1887_17857 [Cichorium endivia]